MTEERLRTRDEFRILTLSRANLRCTVPTCSSVAQDAHHILNRNLFTEDFEEGGYFLTNGAPLCNLHHLNAETTVLSVKTIREWLGITHATIPAQLDPKKEYDTWGNEIVTVCSRKPGPLFNDSGCQKALKAGNVLWTFSS